MSFTARDQFLNFLCAASANGTSAFITNPVDVVKIRMQIDNELGSTVKNQKFYRNIGHGLVRLLKDEGFRGYTRGITASVTRDFFYSGFRMGFYEYAKQLFGATDVHHTPFYKKFLAGACTGGIASVLLNPTDLIKVRLQAHRPGLPVVYTGFINGISTVVRNQGVGALWVGWTPTLYRAIIITAVQVPVYDHTKHTLINYGVMREGVPLHIISAISAGFGAAAATSPIDVIKTRLMNQKRSDCGKFGHTYKGVLDVIVKALRHEGFHAFYKGFYANWSRLAPHTIITFYLFEQFKALAGLRPI